jgi:hypothetical protein
VYAGRSGEHRRRGRSYLLADGKPVAGQETKSFTLSCGVRLDGMRRMTVAALFPNGERNLILHIPGPQRI